MIFSLALAALAAATTFALLFPLLRRAPAAATRLDHELAIYRDQLAELERDRLAGRIGDAEASAAKLEIERRILAAASQAEPAPSAAAEPPRLLPFGLAIALPVAALGLYLAIGRPELPSQPFAARAPAVSDPALAEADHAIAGLRQRIAQKPDDTEPYLELAQLLLLRGKPDDAVGVMREAFRHGAAGAEAHALLAEALAIAAEGIVTPEAQALFRQALAERPGDPRSRYYLGRVEEQAGNARGALEKWLALEADAAPDAPWRAAVTAEIDRLGKSAGIDPLSIDPRRAQRGAPAMPQPSREDVERLEKMTPQERLETIRSMVDGLEARLKDAPDDLQGWLRLANARKQLGEFARAAEALQQADRLKPDDARILADLAEALVRGGEAGKPPSPEAVAVLQRLEKLQPDNGLALFYLAEAAAAAGDRAQAIARFRKLLTLVPPDAPVRPALEKRLEEIEKQ